MEKTFRGIIAATESEKHIAFEWLRKAALGRGKNARAAGIMLTEVAHNKSVAAAAIMSLRSFDAKLADHMHKMLCGGDEEQSR